MKGLEAAMDRYGSVLRCDGSAAASAERAAVLACVPSEEDLVAMLAVPPMEWESPSEYRLRIARAIRARILEGKR